MIGRRSALAAFLLPAACAAPTDGADAAPARACAAMPANAVELIGGEGVLVAAALNGQPARLEINTGLGLTSLIPATATRLNLPEDPRRQSGTLEGGRMVTRRNVSLNRFGLAGLDWGARSLAIRPHEGLYAPNYDGLIGADFLRDAEVELDLPGRRAAFHRLRDCRPEGPPWAAVARVPMTLDSNGVPTIGVRVNGQAVRARIQSGNGFTTLSREAADRIGLGAGQFTGQRSRVTGNTGTGRGEEYRLDELAAGDEVLRDLRVTVLAGGFAAGEEMTLGRDWLARRKVWLSYGGRRMFLAGPGG